MTDVTSAIEAGKAAMSGAGAVDDGLVAELVARAQAGGVKLAGEGGLLQQVTKRVLESALEGELTDHLGHAPGERGEGGRENYRNGHRSKSVITESGQAEIAVPRDRAGSFEPQLAKKRQRRLGGVDEIVLSLSAKGPHSVFPGACRTACARTASGRAWRTAGPTTVVWKSSRSPCRAVAPTPLPERPTARSGCSAR
jgi:hypothetical protein